ncbi:MAG: hypothetical protein ACFFD2_15600 [Promethearchaeota archaeon]
MVEFKSLSPNVEVNGQTILSFVDGLGAIKAFAYRILEDNGINNIKNEGWYPQQSWLNAFKVISEKAGSNTLYGIGTKIPENAKWPPGIDSIESAVNSIDIAYHMNHRINKQIMFNPATREMKEGIGHYSAKKVSEKVIKVVCDNPYPCDFDIGIITSVANKFKSDKVSFINVKHEDPQKCRKKEHNSCIYLVTWT